MDDKILRQNVIDELDWDPGVDSAAIGVTAKDGVVTLSGHVPTYAQKIAAANIARRVRGVKAVAQEIEVFSAFTDDSDENIARRAADVLAWDAALPRDMVKVQVSQGYVTLTGQVDWHYQRNLAEADVRRLSGVVGVTNSIALKPHADAGDIKRRIEAALDRNADVEAKAISVSVADGRVTLGGKVRAWYERKLVENAAWAAPGVHSVDDQLTIAM